MLCVMKKLKHEAELFKAGLLAAMKYAQERGAVEFEPTDSASAKLLYVYRLLVHDKLLQPLPEDQSRKSRCGTSSPSGIRSSCRKIIRC